MYNDNTVNKYCKIRDSNEDSNLPIMNMHERVLSVLGCRFVDDVLIDAPTTITNDMINGLNISSILINKKGRNINENDIIENDPYMIPKQRGIVKYIDYIEHDALSVSDIITRIQLQHERFKKK